MVTKVYPGARWVHPLPLGSLWFALGVEGSLGSLARSPWIFSGWPLGSLVGFAKGVVGFIQGRGVAPWVSLGSSGVVVSTWVRPGDHSVA